jgi:hypothetical protein
MPTVKLSTAMAVSVVKGSATNTAFGATDYFGHEAETDTPTKGITLSCTDGRNVKYFLLTDVQYYLDINGGTHTATVRLYEAAVADDITNSFYEVFDDGGTKAEETTYAEDPNGGKLPRFVELATVNTLLYKVTWSPANPSSSNRGHIRVRGHPLNTRG